jgi:hypothetical protein
MKTAIVATLIAAFLAGAAAASTVAFAFANGESFASLAGLGHDHDGAGADEHKLHGGTAGDGHGAHAQTGMARPLFPPAEGKVPTADDATKLDEVPSLRVLEDKGFNPKNGVRSGEGTLEDPYVISDYYVTGDLYLGDTDACFEIVGNYIAGQLTLNWNGQCVWVHHNFIRDLRVNENIERLGYATGGLIEANQIEFIGQLRHYDGEVRHNIVGPRTADSAFDTVLEETVLIAPDLLLANVDGFNQGYIHHNTFYGPVDLDLHGHHHGTGFFAPHSHYHALDEDRMPDHMEDHTDRWTSVAFTDNKIVDELGYGLRYEDQNHAGDDRTANSEDNEDLEMDHVHRTQVDILRNVVEGGQIWVDVFNADDQNHHKRNDGWLNLVDNTVTVKERKDESVLGLRFLGNGPWAIYEGISLYASKEMTAVVSGNVVTYVPLPDGQQNAGPMGLPVPLPFLWDDETTVTGIRLYDVRDADIRLEDNKVSGFQYGIAAYDMDEDTEWTVVGNVIEGAQQDVYYDDSVANKPDAS